MMMIQALQSMENEWPFDERAEAFRESSDV
jgi:hypothetical protein